jgi:hypothetical protein
VFIYQENLNHITIKSTTKIKRLTLTRILLGKTTSPKGPTTIMAVPDTIEAATIKIETIIQTNSQIVSEQTLPRQKI